MHTSNRKVSLKTGIDKPFLPLVLSFAEESVRAFGFGMNDANRIRLASEEIFLYLCDTSDNPGEDLTIEILSGIYYVEARFLFRPVQFDPYALNLTARVNPDEEDLRNLGLLIASRSVDHFYIQHDLREGLGFVLVKEKSYPDLPMEDAEKEFFTVLDSFSLVSPDNPLIKRFIRNACRKYDETSLPSRYRHPAKVVDMAASGDYRLIVATGSGKQSLDIGGGLLWHRVGKGMIEFFGPYVFDTKQSNVIASGLVDRLLGDVAKTTATFVVTSYGTPELPRDYFELLGEITYGLPKGGKATRPFLFRQLHEDPGCQILTHPNLIPFLKTAYERLYLPRETIPMEWQGEKRETHSAFTVRFDRLQKSARLRPVWDGEDAAANLAGHKAIITREGFDHIFFEMDLGQPWQGLLTPALLENGFEPVLVMPSAGKGDLVVFQCR